MAAGAPSTRAQLLSPWQAQSRLRAIGHGLATVRSRCLGSRTFVGDRDLRRRIRADPKRIHSADDFALSSDGWVVDVSAMLISASHAFFWRFRDDLTAVAHKHLIPNDIFMPMGEVRREQMAFSRIFSG